MNELDVISILERLGYHATKSRYGDEYHSNCPKCADPEGDDRLVIFPDGNAYCRRCGTWWNADRMARQFLGHGAGGRDFCQGVMWGRAHSSQKILRVMNDTIPSQSWSIFMEKLVDQMVGIYPQGSWGAHEMVRRGLRPNFAEVFGVGYNDRDLFIDGEVLKVPKSHVFIPQGLIVFYDHEVDGKVRCIKAKVRRQKNDDALPKYIQISGSANQPMVFGYCCEKIPLIVESELDAVLCLQEASSLVWTVALGGAGKPIDEYTDKLLQKSQCILWALDQDAAGRNQFCSWKNRYPQLRAWPADKAKSPGDMPVAYLYDWIVKGFSRCSIAA